MLIFNGSTWLRFDNKPQKSVAKCPTPQKIAWFKSAFPAGIEQPKT